ncbi:TetR/AcrR family transcriptional regulator [Gilvimarinus sp. F26214L]|uniref:TetR/AcrR family transcriptional regulator n=1 Tax=Gilvimarinus sp. DZF01 TaxID=3461371 RepID=UPI0040456C76
MTTDSPQPRSKPRKRPTQARARFTVQAIFEAYVRIWRRDGWERLTTRAVALEAGVAVGTLYDYFPSKEALHSGYVRHCIECLIAAIEAQAIAPPDLSWQQRVHRLLHLLSGLEREGLAWFEPAMLRLENRIAEPKHQQRAYTELKTVWQRLFAACDDLPALPAEATIEALHLAVWGGRRYAMLVGLERERMEQWVAEMERLCHLSVATPVMKTP